MRKMINFANNEPYSESKIEKAIQKRKILGSDVKHAQIYQFLKKFVDNDISDIIFLSQQPGLVQAITNSLKIVSKKVLKPLQRMWMSLFFIHAFFQMIIQKDYINIQTIIQALLLSVDTIITQIYQQKKPQTQKNQSGFIKSSLDSIRRSLSLKKINKLFIGTKQQTKKDPNHFMMIQSYTKQLLIEYSRYLQKMLMDYPQFEVLIDFNKQSRQNKTQKNKKPTVIVARDPNEKQIIWKIFNLYTKILKIVEQIKKIGLYFQSINPFVYSTINFLSIDIILFYSPVLNYVKAKVAEIEQSAEIQEFKKSKKKPNSQLLLKLDELKCMLEQLGKVNQTGLYICRSHPHYEHLQKKKSFEYISLNDHTFDIIYKLFRDADNAEKKQELHQSKENRNNTFALRMKDTSKVANYKSSKISSMLTEKVRPIQQSASLHIKKFQAKKKSSNEQVEQPQN